MTDQVINRFYDINVFLISVAIKAYMIYTHDPPTCIIPNACMFLCRDQSFGNDPSQIQLTKLCQNVFECICKSLWYILGSEWIALENRLKPKLQVDAIHFTVCGDSAFKKISCL